MAKTTIKEISAQVESLTMLVGTMLASYTNLLSTVKTQQELLADQLNRIRGLEHGEPFVTEKRPKTLVIRVDTRDIAAAKLNDGIEFAAVQKALDRYEGGNAIEFVKQHKNLITKFEHPTIVEDMTAPDMIVALSNCSHYQGVVDYLPF